jgi:hypothetical protein
LGDFAQAEDVSRAAAELEPQGYWPHHAVSHVLEMTGRPEQGLAWMNERAAVTAPVVGRNRSIPAILLPDTSARTVSMAV